MLPYFAVTVLAIGLALLSKLSGELVPNGFPTGRLAKSPTTSTRRWNVFDVSLVGLLVTFSATRWEVGTDFDLYRRLFERLETTGWREQVERAGQEPGYTLVALATRLLTDSSSGIFWVSSALTVLPFYAAMKRLSLDIAMATTLYILLAYYVAPFNIVRQGIAIGMMLLAYSYLRERNWLRFVILALLAGTFHYSALIAAIALLASLKWSPGRVQLVGTVVVGSALGPLLSGGRLDALLLAINPRYVDYIGAEAAGLGTYLVFASRIALICLCAALRPQDEEEARQLGLIAVGAALLLATADSEVFNRVEYYFSALIVILLSTLR